jgi:cellobiose phosphorylase
MTLNQLDFNGYGGFSESNRGTFKINTIHLPTTWDFIFQNRKILLRVDQLGVDYAQAFPPSDVMLFRRDGYQKSSAWMTWFASSHFSDGAFTNFFHPNLGAKHPNTSPEKFEVIYSPSHASYLLEHEGIRVFSKIFVPSEETAIVMSVQFTNLRDETIPLSVFPVLRHTIQWANRDVWDKPEWYLRTAFVNHPDELIGFSIHLTDPKCQIENRRGFVLWSSPEQAVAAEVSHEKFVGSGTFDFPQAVYERSLELDVKKATPIGEYNNQNNIFAYPPVCALQYNYELQPSETQTINQVFSWIELDENGRLPDITQAKPASKFLSTSVIEQELGKLKTKYEKFSTIRGIETPDTKLNQYVNEWLPLQLDWVCSLDRGHPSGMRGGRDSANDFTAMAPLLPNWTREIILTQLSCQRPDGWIPRHYSARGHAGKERDSRQHVDAAAWVIEMIYEYLAWTKDFNILNEQLPWLDKPEDKTDSILEHTLRIIEFYINPENIGEHGLVKLAEGEWLDTVNKAGLLGRGEGVMITNQVIMCLTWMIEILERLVEIGQYPHNDFTRTKARYEKAIVAFRTGLRENAYNEEGYFNGFFNDDGHWLFSPKDPDGARRVYGPASWWSITSGVAVPDLVDSCLKELDFLKTDMGYYLNYPPFVRQQIPRVGRMASGDSPPGRSEHANPYNQGSHGFLARALAVAGRGNLLYDVFKMLLPYDQYHHPIDQTMTAPYGVVNVWEDIPRFKNRGKNTFLTGSIGYATRTAYDWMLGIKPTMSGLTIDPCIPSHFSFVKGWFTYQGKQFHLRVHNPLGNQVGLKKLELNGIPIISRRTDPFSKRRTFFIHDNQLQAIQTHHLNATL